MKNKKKCFIALLLIILLLLFVILYTLFWKEKSFIITFDTNGGTPISSIEVKDNEIVKLPEVPSKEEYKFVAWINEDGKVILLPINPTKEGYTFAGCVDENGNEITKDTIVNKNITIKAL